MERLNGKRQDGMNGKKKGKKQYLIGIQKWRSFVALAACIVTLLFSIIAIVGSVLYYERHSWAISDLFRYFTTLANILTALAAGFIIPFAVEGIRKKRFVLPRWLSLFFYSGTVCTTIIIVFVFALIMPYDPEFALGGNNFYLHIVCPVTVLISFMLVESHHTTTWKDTLLCLLPFIIYSFVYIIMVVVVGEDHGGWEDLYMLKTFVPAYVSFPIAWGLAYGIAFVIKKISERLSRLRRIGMFASWEEDASPVEVNIEVYGLGRYYGLHGDENELVVPYDILEALAEKYSMEPDRLVKVYMKGLMDGIKESSAQA